MDERNRIRRQLLNEEMNPSDIRKRTCDVVTTCSVGAEL